MKRSIAVRAGGIAIMALAISVLAAPTVASPTSVRVRVPATDVSNEIESWVKAHPASSTAEIARFANSLISTRGVCYRFSACRLVPKGTVDYYTVPVHPVPLKAASPDGKQMTVLFESSFDEGMCGECTISVPLSRAPSGELDLVSRSGPVSIRMPAVFDSETMELVDRTLKRRIRSWTVPNQAYPAGISADGQELFVRYDGYPSLALGIRGSRLRFVAGSDLQGVKLEEIKDGPTDPRNAYLGFMKLTVDAQDHYIRFSYPCT